jgi:hypothetical protein
VKGKDYSASGFICNFLTNSCHLFNSIYISSFIRVSYFPNGGGGHPGPSPSKFAPAKVDLFECTTNLVIRPGLQIVTYEFDYTLTMALCGTLRNHLNTQNMQIIIYYY